MCAVACLQAPLVLAAGHKQQQGGLHNGTVMAKPQARVAQQQHPDSDDALLKTTNNH
jgi:hypothetical protein